MLVQFCKLNQRGFLDLSILLNLPLDLSSNEETYVPGYKPAPAKSFYFDFSLSTMSFPNLTAASTDAGCSSNVLAPTVETVAS